METVLSSMISNLALPPAPPPSQSAMELVPSSTQMDSSGTPTPPNSSTSTSASFTAVRTPSAISPATNASTPGIVHSSASSVQHHQMMMDNQQPSQQQQQQRASRTFFRPPGLGPEGIDGSEQFPTNVLSCPHCGFSCSSKFHYNSHMNTHTTHQCSMCNYQSRTEGRLKKHMQQSHTDEQKMAAGICISPPAPAAPIQTAGRNSPRAEERAVPWATAADGGNNGGNHHPNGGRMTTTIGPLLNNILSDNPMAPNGGSLGLESLQSILNNTNSLTHFSNSTDALLKICTDAIANANNGQIEKAYANSPQMADHHGPTALDQLRALAERQAANLLTTSTENTLGGFVGDMQICHKQQQDARAHGGGAQENGSGGDSGKDGQTPRRSGKPKQYKCKQCQQISRSKKEQWAHAKTHIPKQKQLTCQICDFVTEYKHHLEYHYRNHNGQKPFKCSTCAYTCVNKSMLNSHMKSHTPVYQFRCQDCTYQTKYCHSLKMHLKKYSHKRAPGPGGSDSSDSHDGEERPENASSSSVGKDESFDGGGGSGGHEEEMADLAELTAAMGSGSGGGGGMPQMANNNVHNQHALLMAHQQPSSMVGAGSGGGGAEMELAASQRFLLQQQLEQMSELIRTPVVNCPHCNYSTGNIDEMNRHLLCHLIATQQQLPAPLNNEQQALASIYQRVAAQLQQELASSEGPIQHAQSLDPSILLGHALSAAAANSTMDVVPMEMEKARQMERDAAESIRQQQGNGGCGSRTSGGGGHHQRHQQLTTTNGTTALCGRGTNGLEATTSSRGGTECGGENGRHSSAGESGTGATSGSSIFSNVAALKKEYQQQQHQFDHFQLGNNNNNNNSSSNGEQMNSRSQSSTSLGGQHPNGQEQQRHQRDTEMASSVQTSSNNNVMPHLLSTLPGFEQNETANGCGSSNGNGFGQNTLNHFQNIHGNLPFYCQQCEIAFKNGVLHQLHCGYHSIESPFKCNRCGHVSVSALEFNLHLYQAKHE